MQALPPKPRYVSRAAVAACPELAGLDDPPTRAPAVRGIVEMASGYAEEAMATLQALLYSETEGTRIVAAKEILDRAYGRPVQAVATGFDGKLTISWLRQGDDARVIEGDTT